MKQFFTSHRAIGLFILQLLFFSTLLYSQSKVETHTFYSDALGLSKSYRIYLPDGYNADTSVSYPVVYFLRLHENEWFNPVWRSNGKTLKNVADDLMNNGTIGKMILIGPSTGGNNSDPNQTDFGIVNMLRPDLADDGGIGTGAFENCIIHDLIPHIDSTFRTIPEWCARGVDGFSLGGFASTLYAIKHPGVFSSVGSYDGTIMWYNLDYPVTPGPLDDYNWFYQPWTNFIAPMFDLPFDTLYMKANSAMNVLAEADSVTLDSIRAIAFHIHAGVVDATTNREVNEQFIDFLASKGISNTFSNLILNPSAVHSYDWADMHAKQSLVKHWETFSSFSCEADTTVTAVRNPGQVAQGFELYENFPNPAQTSTTIEFRLPAPGNVTLCVLDALGKGVQSVSLNALPAGVHQIQLDVSGYENGVYYLQLESKSQIGRRKLLVLK
ncbi:MAG: alpha/beta hydrolase-fold protein [Saprospiraceae bacterium]